MMYPALEYLHFPNFITAPLGWSHSSSTQSTGQNEAILLAPTMNSKPRLWAPKIQRWVTQDLPSGNSPSRSRERPGMNSNVTRKHSFSGGSKALREHKGGSHRSFRHWGGVACRQLGKNVLGTGTSIYKSTEAKNKTKPQHTWGRP